MTNSFQKYRSRWMRTGLFMLLASLFMTSCGDKDANVNVKEREKDRVRGVDIASALKANEYERLYAQMSDSLKGIVKLEDFRSMGQQFVSEVDAFRLESHLSLNGADSFVWSDSTGQKGLTATLDEKLTLAGIQIINHVRYPETDEAYSATTFDFPFRGEWLVFWGGKNTFVNYHYEHEQIRYAYDFIVEKGGFSYEGDAASNESYFAYGQDILAPADGEIVAVHDGVPDNVPVGSVNEAQPAGNFVTIKHKNGEFSTLAHLRNGSVKVKAGDRVSTGQLLGYCGNSGNSTEPHLHFQASSGDAETRMGTIPITWNGGLKPVRGDRVTGTAN